NAYHFSRPLHSALGSRSLVLGVGLFPGAPAGDWPLLVCRIDLPARGGAGWLALRPLAAPDGIVSRSPWLGLRSPRADGTRRARHEPDGLDGLDCPASPVDCARADPPFGGLSGRSVRGFIHPGRTVLAVQPTRPQPPFDGRRRRPRPRLDSQAESG